MVKVIRAPLPPLSDPMWSEPATRSSPPTVRREPEQDKADRHDDAEEKPPAPPTDKPVE
jgi:hypothetical protein